MMNNCVFDFKGQ